MASNPYTLPTLTAGMLIGNTELQAIVDAVNWGQGTPQGGKSRRPVFHLVQTVAQSIANSGDQAILFDSEVTDTDAGHSTSTNTSRYTFQTAGLVVVVGFITYASNATGNRKAAFRLNGVSNAYYSVLQDANASGRHGMITAGLLPPVAVGDYLELIGSQSSTVAINTDVSTATSGGSRLAGFMLSA